MSRIGWTALLLTAAAGVLAGTARADDGRQVKIQARGPWPDLPIYGVPADRVEHQWVIRSEEELARAAGHGALITIPKALQVEAIDFKKQMLLATEDGTQPLVGVSGGGPPSALYAVAVTRVARDGDDKTMTVQWRRVPRARDQEVLTRPLEAVLVARFDGEVKFEKLPPTDKAEKEGPKPAGKEDAVVARAFWPDGWRPEAARQQWVIRNYADLIDPRLKAPEPVLERMRREAAARYAKALKVDGIDFTKQMIVGVSGGVQLAGSHVEVTAVESDAKGEALTVSWRLHTPKATHPAAGISHPAEVVLVERSAGDVKFRKEGAKKE